MHASFPVPAELKLKWLGEAMETISKASKEADIIVISHYHYDHFTDFDKELYNGKIILAKNPNRYINDSQRKRALRFFNNLYTSFGLENFDESLLDPKEEEYSDPLEKLPLSSSLDLGEYNERRRNLLEAGRKWFEKRVEKWNKYRRVPELALREIRVLFADGKVFTFGNTKIRFSEPLFHGIEFSRVGWVISTVIEYKGWKFIHSSDLNGPIIEDYASWIIDENPDVLVLDGPMTYMLGYTLNMINFRRTLENAKWIVEETDTNLIIYDHHLPREPKFRERTREVWDIAEKLGRKVLTAAEYLGRKPVVIEGLSGK